MGKKSRSYKSKRGKKRHHSSLFAEGLGSIDQRYHGMCVVGDGHIHHPKALASIQSSTPVATGAEPAKRFQRIDVDALGSGGLSESADPESIIQALTPIENQIRSIMNEVIQRNPQVGKLLGEVMNALARAIKLTSYRIGSSYTSQEPKGYRGHGGGFGFREGASLGRSGQIEQGGLVVLHDMLKSIKKLDRRQLRTLLKATQSAMTGAGAYDSSDALAMPTPGGMNVRA